MQRRLGLWQMVLYGLGTTVGAGIYALIGELAAVAGAWAPLAFLVSALLAGATALSFAELSGRYPRAAGSALYVQRGLGSRHLAVVAGMLMVTAGMTSAAALINAFVAQLGEVLPVPRVPAMIVLMGGIAGLAVWGIAQSVLVAGVITLVEITGLVLVIGFGAPALVAAPEAWAGPVMPPVDQWHAVLLGGLIGFYAFIGFEDMVEVAEEVKQVRRTLPRAIVITLAVTTLLYLLVTLVAVRTIDPERLATEAAPLAAVFEVHRPGSSGLLATIGLFAVLNGALIQVIMVSRVLYGLASRGQLPAAFARVGRRGTPWLATLMVAAVVLVLAVAGRLGALAEATSFMVLVVFALVNLALCRIKRREAVLGKGFSVPRWLPWAGFLVCSGFILGRAAGVLGG
ncbi:APC family permease [Algiphilus sp.]|uniref:APC family permease n=1 Tax=Algiphilus sp. TaxID=1872431 RepID=UPI003C5E8562